MHVRANDGVINDINQNSEPELMASGFVVSSFISRNFRVLPCISHANALQTKERTIAR